MLTLFAICAVVGGTVLTCQFVMTVIGLGVDSDFDGADVNDVSGLPADGMDFNSVDVDPGDAHASSALFGILTFRTVTAAAAFFGLAGLAADAADLTAVQTMIVAVGAGLASMYGIHHLMQLFSQLRSDGTVRLYEALNQQAVVYLRIPGHRTGHGKIHILLKQQTVELQAETNGPEIPNGTTVRVTQFVGSDIVSVEPVAAKVVEGLMSNVEE